ncbi:MAG: PAS domain-containing protein, partial [Desulfobacteraceae bacterium]|nr:PAS domain-containing protein [Desulfobacteraceae bacterium]
MHFSSLVGLINNAALLLALGLIYDIIEDSPQVRSKSVQQIVTGIALGIIGIAIMLNPWEFMPGVVFDTRSVLLGISGLFFGTVPTLIAVLMTGGYRLYLGGTGACTGVAVIVTSGCIGLVWRHLRPDKEFNISVRELYFFGIAVHVAMLLWMFSLPWQIAKGVLSRISLPVLFIFPLTTALLGWLMTSRSARKRSKEALNQSEERFQMAMEASKDGIWDWDIETGEVYYSPGYSAMLGYNSTEVPSHINSWQDLIHPEDRDKALLTNMDCIENRCADFQVEFRMHSKNGQWRWILGQGRAVERDINGKAVRMVGTHTDITSRKQVEEALRKSEKELAIKNKVADIFLTTPNDNMYAEVLKVVLETMESPYGTFAYINEDGDRVVPSMTREISSECEMPDKGIFFPRETWGNTLWGRCLVEKKSFSSNGPFSFPEGHVPIARALATPIVHKDKAIGNLMIGDKQTDYTEQDIALLETIANHIAPILYSRLLNEQYEKEKKVMEQKLIQIQKIESIGTLAGGIAHDFNNILFPIVGMSELLLEDLPEGSPEHENTQEILLAGIRGSELVKQILSFSRQHDHKLSPIRIQKTLEEVIKLSRSTIPSNIKIRENIQQNCRLVLADPIQAHQIAMNLITNAFHAVEEKNGVIDIELKEITLKKDDLPDSLLTPGQYIRLSVSDNGIGMEPGTINKLFEPYFTTKEKGKGTGLGLAVVYGIVKEFRGDIKVYSEVGKGSTFNIFLPIMEKTSEIAAGDHVPKIETGIETILLVDDEESVVKLEGQILSRLGYQVTQSTKSTEALNLFKTGPEDFDLVITDMTMPDLTGDQLAKEILLIKP